VHYSVFSLNDCMTVGITPLKRIFDDWYHGGRERRRGDAAISWIWWCKNLNFVINGITVATKRRRFIRLYS